MANSEGKKNWMSAEDIEAEFGVSRRHAYDLMHALGAVRIGKKSLRLARQKLDEYLEQQS